MVLWITWILIVAPQKGACLENPTDRRSPTDYSLSSVQLLSWLFATPWTAACQASLSITNSQSSLKLMSIESVMSPNHLILCHPLLLLPSIFPSIRVFSDESVLCIRWPKYWSFSFSISPSNEYSGLISFRMDCLDLLAVQGTLKSLLQDHSSKASILWRSAFFIVQLKIPWTEGARWATVYRVTMSQTRLKRLSIAKKDEGLTQTYVSHFISKYFPFWFSQPAVVISNPFAYNNHMLIEKTSKSIKIMINKTVVIWWYPNLTLLST